MLLASTGPPGHGAHSAELRSVADRLSSTIRPHPHRGDVIAAGSTVLTVGVATVNARMAPHWDVAVLLVVSLLGFALVFGMGVLAPREAAAPRAYQSILLVAGLVLEAITLYRLDQVLGTHRPLGSSGSVSWMSCLLAGTAALTAVRLGSAICTLVAAVAGTAALLALVNWVFAPTGLSTFRYLLALAIVGLGLGATSLRDRHRRHAVALADAAGLAALAIGVGYLLGDVVASFIAASGGSAAAMRLGAAHPGVGWALVMLAVGFGLLAYGTVEQEPGPGYLGFFILLVFVLTVGPAGDRGASLLGWPIVLLALGATGIVVGLRPRRALPPPPDAHTELASTTPIFAPGPGDPPNAGPTHAPEDRS